MTIVRLPLAILLALCQSAYAAQDPNELFTDSFQFTVPCNSADVNSQELTTHNGPNGGPGRLWQLKPWTVDPIKIRFAHILKISGGPHAWFMVASNSSGDAMAVIDDKQNSSPWPGIYPGNTFKRNPSIGRAKEHDYIDLHGLCSPTDPGVASTATLLVTFGYTYEQPKNWEVTAGPNTLDADSPGWAGHTLTTTVDPMVATYRDYGTKLRVRFAAGSDGCEITKAYIGPRIPGTAQSAANLKQLTFLRSPQVSISANKEVLSDELPAGVVGAGFVVKVYTRGACTWRTKASHSGWQSYYTAGDDAANLTGNSTPGDAVTGVVAIEKYFPPAP
jgi:hypothetical protein